MKKILIAFIALMTMTIITGCGGNSEMNNVEIEKTSSCRISMTVSATDEIIYTVRVKNNSSKEIKACIKDQIPEHTSYVSGEVNVNVSELSRHVRIPAGEIAELSYTVCVDSSAEIDGVVFAPEASVGNNKSNSVINYMGCTLNAVDREYIKKGIAVLSYSENIDPVSLVKHMYSVAFSTAPSISGEPEEILNLIFEKERTDIGDSYRKMVPPTLFGARNPADIISENFRGESVKIDTDDMIEGDILIAENEKSVDWYIYNGEDLILLSGYFKNNAEEVIASLDNSLRYAVLRFSLGFKTFEHYGNENPGELSDAQSALVATAEAYLNRGYRIQYDDTRMPASYYTSSDRGEFRWQIGQYSPEDYTSAKWGYINCAAFTYELYRNALGYDLKTLYTTANLASFYKNGGKAGSPMYPYDYTPHPYVTDEEKKSIENSFFSTLEVGDLVVIRRNNGNGHVMMYIGNKTVIHSSGSSFNYNKDQETYEPTVRYMNLEWYLFDENASNYIFNKSGYIERLCVVRPLDSFSGDIPLNTLNRIENLDNIVSEKISSVGEGGSVNVGDEVAFKFVIQNFGGETKTLEISDTLPENAALKSEDGAVVDGNKMTWRVTVNGNESVEVYYVITVCGSEGEFIYGEEAKVGGVIHTCPKIYIKKTLNEMQKAAIKEAVNKFKKNNPEGLTGLDLVNAIYSEAGIEAPFLEGDAEIDGQTLRGSLFISESSSVNQAQVWSLNSESKYYSMIAPTLYGGRRFFTPQRYTAEAKPNTDRSRLPREADLVVGDVLITKFLSSEAMYMYVGDGTFVNLGKATLDDDTYSASVRLMRLMSAGNYYVVLRPSFLSE